jgi:hypothetical protein
MCGVYVCFKCVCVCVRVCGVIEFVYVMCVWFVEVGCGVCVCMCVVCVFV